jgi:hypothetical protein
VIEAARRKWAQILAERRLSATSVWPLLQDYLVRTKSTGCSYIDYWHLHLAVQRYRPKLILELGTGASTIVLAEAARGYGGHVVSMEESEEWHRHAIANLPADLPVEIVLSETVEDAFSIFRGMRYRDVPPGPYEFVFVDGPTYKTKSGEITFDLDLIRVVERAEVPLRGLIDKRISTCFVMQRVLPGKVRYARHLGLGFIEAVTRADLRGIDPTTPSTSFKLGTLIDFDGL